MVDEQLRLVQLAAGLALMTVATEDKLTQASEVLA